MKKTCRMTEEEVISEFLKSEFYQVEYDCDRALFENVVYEPDLSNPEENALRRALLFRRRGTMWRELPRDIEWWEIDFKPEEASRVKVFPRAQWRTVAQGNFNAIHIAERMRILCKNQDRRPFVLKVLGLCSLMQREGPRSTILLIGVDENRSVTLLEGNHRFIASLLLPRELMLNRLRLVCGFSPRMERCCWYKTSFASLAHYLKNRIQYFQNREADVSRWLSLPARDGKSKGKPASIPSTATTSAKTE
ncbi:MAG TPA: hypothetical protein VFY05_13880 [Candidatus Angelobacter sp.]|nr:hypothetical protein [Candidatus Angelobacter sp.]